LKQKYKAEVHRVIDGDTVVFDVHLEFGISKRVEVRLLGVDTAETYNVDESSRQYQLGKKHEQFVRSWLNDTETLYLRVDEKGKFGRWLGEVFDEDQNSLNNTLLAEFDVDYE
jgi:endonuclease YncB( thermonuclease family)